MALVQLMYASVLHPELLDEDAMRRLLVSARDNNRQHDVTGVLLISDAQCFQILEGPSDSVDALYATIAMDSRHRDVSLMVRARVFERIFQQGSLAEARAEAAELAEVTGVDIRSVQFKTASLGKRQATALIEALQHQTHWFRSEAI